MPVDGSMRLYNHLKKGIIELGSLSHIRGRSIDNAIILADEVQNINADDMKTILTRAGTGTKFVLCGDVEQIDNRDLDAMNNGLSRVIDAFKDSPLAGHMTFTKSVRSRLAEAAADLL